MTGVSIEVIRAIKASLDPLGGDEILPKRTVLREWWERVRYALEAADADC